MKLKVLKSIYLLSLLFSIVVASCVDDFPYRNFDIPEGESTLYATVTFTPDKATNLGATRTEGNALNDINSLCVLVYNDDEEGTLFRKYTQAELLKYTPSDYKVDPDKDFDKDEDDVDNVNGAHTDEEKTKQVSFEIPDLPYGRYYMFAVANMEDLPESKYDYSTIDKLQNISLTWNTDNIKFNNQMFGYFTSANDAESKGFKSEEPITFTGRTSDSKIHAWLKRAASKVTVAFDPSGLNQGVEIYIRNVTIRDFPKTCLLGAENKAENVTDLLNHVDAPYNDPDANYGESSSLSGLEPYSYLEYNSQGVITEESEHTGTIKTDGLLLNNSIRSAVPKNAHAVNAPSLFFYENMQGNYEKKDPPLTPEELKRYDKRPQKEGADQIGTTIHDPGNDKDFKDRVELGTYVEVEAYYISSNPANPGEGPIKYRFMLGKNITFDYDAQRNYHYKLTLGFNGWANDPDWHIDYVMTTPVIEVPPVFRVSYLYMQMSELPIKIVGDIEYLTVTITENNWAPYDPNQNTNQTLKFGTGENVKEYKFPKGTIESSPSDYEFKWNDAVFATDVYKNPTPPDKAEYPENLPAGQLRPQFGFLALHIRDKNTTTISTEYSPTANAELIEYWKTNQEGVRRFSNDNSDFTIGSHNESWGDIGKGFPTENNKYTVNAIYNDNNVALENQRILMLPVWTRAKTLIQTSGFSGNNPYEAFERKAVLHIAGLFNMGEGVDKMRIEKDVEVYQVKRITNPKGVWRAYNSNNIFNVTLLEPINSNAESNFQAFTSQGEWTAYIDEVTNNENQFSLRPNGETNGYMKDGKIYGNTGSEIHFAIDFGPTVEKNHSVCAVVKVLYHGNQCMHKILVRKGYNEPLRMGGVKDDNSDGKLWSSFTVYQATKSNNKENGREVFDAVLTKNPLMLGSMFRRGKLDEGIFVWNNMQDGLGPFDPPGNTKFIVGKKSDNAPLVRDAAEKEEAWKKQWEAKDWDEIGYRDDANTEANRNNNMGTFYADDANGQKRRYRVPTVEEFQALTENSEFGFGVFYGSAASEPQMESKYAYGLIDPLNEGLFEDPNGMRAVVAYDKKTGNQILFPIGRYGIGVRRMYNTYDGGWTPNYQSYYGNLHYSDVYQPLTEKRNPNNIYRPIPYNLPIVSGSIYWVDQWQDAGNYEYSDERGEYKLTSSCLGWDMNYFNFDFNAYTANNYRDACQIKFVVDEE